MTGAYYNEIDPGAAEWLRELIKADLIAPGDVDERSVSDVKPDDLRGYTQCHFFAGIGVWSYALRRAGWDDDRPVWTGSCPCQPFSSAGKRSGTADERHLWPHWHHLIAERRPAVIFGEQVASKDGLAWLDIVQADLEGMGYASGSVDTCSAGFGAPHIRQRQWFCAYDLRLAAGGLVDSIGPGLEGLGGNGHGGGEPGRVEANEDRPVTEASSSGELADTGSPGVRRQSGSGDGSPGENGREARQQRGGLDGGGSGPTVGLADEHGDGRSEEGRSSASTRGNGAFGDGPAGDPCPTNGQWRSADWLFCRDGKWRAVEPGTFPLVDGAAGRVGRLRGYGNAINSAAAQGFIEAAKEALDECLRLNDVSGMADDNYQQGVFG